MGCDFGLLKNVRGIVFFCFHRRACVCVWHGIRGVERLLWSWSVVAITKVANHVNATGLKACASDQESYGELRNFDSVQWGRMFCIILISMICGRHKMHHAVLWAIFFTCCIDWLGLLLTTKSHWIDFNLKPTSNRLRVKTDTEMKLLFSPFLWSLLRSHLVQSA